MTFAYVGALYRLEEAKQTEITQKATGLGQIIARLAIFSLVCGLSICPMLFNLISLEDAGSVGHFWLYYSIPMGFVGWFTTGGIYDMIVDLVELMAGAREVKKVAEEDSQ